MVHDVDNFIGYLFVKEKIKLRTRSVDNDGKNEKTGAIGPLNFCIALRTAKRSVRAVGPINIVTG